MVSSEQATKVYVKKKRSKMERVKRIDLEGFILEVDEDS